MDTATCRLPSYLQHSRCQLSDTCDDPSNCTASIEPGELLAIDVPRLATLHVRVMQGTVWATDGASGSDHFVRSNRTWQAGAGRALLSSLDGAATLRWRIDR